MPICYMDMTWCPYGASCSKSRTCFRVPTLLDERQAVELGLPMAWFTEPPPCFLPFEEITDADYPEVPV